MLQNIAEGKEPAGMGQQKVEGLRDLNRKYENRQDNKKLLKVQRTLGGALQQ